MARATTRGTVSQRKGRAWCLRYERYRRAACSGSEGRSAYANDVFDELFGCVVRGGDVPTTPMTLWPSDRRTLIASALSFSTGCRHRAGLSRLGSMT